MAEVEEKESKKHETEAESDDDEEDFETPSEILPNLYQASSDILRKDDPWLTDTKIACVVAVGVELPSSEVRTQLKLQTMEVKIEDDIVSDINRHFLMCCKFIHSARLKGGAVCVYSRRGISRSSAIILSYMMAHLGVSYKEASATLRIQRSSIQPNEGFVEQLTNYEKDLLFIRGKLNALEQSGAGESGGLERKDREYLEKQGADESWLKEWSDSRTRTISTVTSPAVAKRDQVLFERFLSLDAAPSTPGRTTRARSLIPSFNSNRATSPSPAKRVMSPSPGQRRDQKSLAPPPLPTLRVPMTMTSTTLEDWDLPRSSGRMRSATSWEIVDKHGHKDLWLPEDFILPPAPKAPAPKPIEATKL